MMLLVHLLAVISLFQVTDCVFMNFFRDVRDFLHDNFNRNSEEVTQMNEWECGADKFYVSKYISHKAAATKCPSVMDRLNNICRAHDFCYSNGIEGQKYCDDKFCAELKDVQIENPMENFLCTLRDSMCVAVRIGGGLVYVDKSSNAP